MIRPATISPGSTIGVLGGGQLGRMFAVAAAQMGYQVVAFTPESDAPVSQVCSKTYTASFDDSDALKQFAREVRAVTVEFENIPAQALETLQSLTAVRPGPAVLHTTQNRLREKNFLAKHGFPVVPFRPVCDLADLQAALKSFRTPGVLKTAGFGYDGKGQVLVQSEDAAQSAFASMQGQPAVVEQFVEFDKEFSVIGARSVSGDFVAYGPIENRHSNHILDISFAPARLSWTLAEEAIDMTRSIMEKLEVVGLLCVEFFLTGDESILVNELAPRPHNSGHYSIEACPTSQFEQQVRTLTGLPLGTTEAQKGAAMANLLGDLWAAGEPDWPSAVALPELHLHLYGKREARPGRKMGHLTACAKWADEAVGRVKNARELLMKVRA